MNTRREIKYRAYLPKSRITKLEKLAKELQIRVLLLEVENVALVNQIGEMEYSKPTAY